MDKEMIEKMKKNTSAYVNLGSESQKILDEAHETQNLIYYNTQKCVWHIKLNSSFLDDLTIYRLSPDFTPEPKVIRCEVKRENSNGGELCFMYDGKKYLDALPRYAKWTGKVVYADGTESAELRRFVGNGQPAEYPVAVLFAK